jgi:hypothetical protein
MDTWILYGAECTLISMELDLTASGNSFAFAEASRIIARRSACVNV